ncbi:class III poly(R)-hydroxyalkanoic acid synthase subunit PhaC [Candidatus Nitrosotenuis uzonensis]|uniref:Poly(3-hydroxyalkanoate) polymerase subunit PhaC n=1 Tax=Candidatus Nitrosotenuis uzonensis TaxID=1407055 RepID=V6ATL6_9ARCH|nr:class III poly(R)-hydroxyalkanoic acid synthase subunit PhaC [Candidatus Nitrosotenuis uzonensis]CDI05778.1 Poly(R)-hydroxyalkanoic acid synthase, class III, PhaC subunit [Candidatus Nitrosotenuis uzonensis]
MRNETIDPKIVEEFLSFTRNVAEAPKLVPAPDEISLESTPYDIAYEEDKMRLLHFRPTVQSQTKVPFLISYAIINRYHILDIQQEKSWVRKLLESGIDVYMIDWGNPSNIDKYLDFDDYVNTYMENCVDFVRKESDVRNVSLQGYCTGGTIATIYAALHPEKVRNLVVTAPVIDGWKDTTVVSNMAKHIDVDKLVESIGNMPPEFMYYCFSILKPFEQGLEKYYKFFKNIHDKNFVDSFLRVEKWLSETPPIPGELFKQWIKDIYQDNLLIQNKMFVGGRQIDLQKITMPIFIQIAVGDHLVSPECSMPLYYAVASQDKTLRIYPTGHVGMIASSYSQKQILPELCQWIKER